MKRVFFSAIALVLIMGSCVSGSKGKSVCKNNCCAKSEMPAECAKMLGDNSEKTICGAKQKGEVVEILYLHGKQRSATCNAIEKLTTEVVNEKFARELKDGKLQMSVIDITTTEGEKIASRYDVSLSSLLVNKWIDGKESSDNLTELGFKMAESNPEEFKLHVEAKLVMLLK